MGKSVETNWGKPTGSTHSSRIKGVFCFFVRLALSNTDSPLVIKCSGTPKALAVLANSSEIGVAEASGKEVEGLGVIETLSKFSLVGYLCRGLKKKRILEHLKK